MEYALISALAAGLYVSTKHSKKENFDNLEEQIYSGVEGMENYTGDDGEEEENENPINGNAVNCVQIIIFETSTTTMTVFGKCITICNLKNK